MDHLNQKQLEKTATAYEKLLVPALFQEWADRLAKIYDIESAHKILDVACGTGVLARAVARQLPKSSVTGLDLNPGMLAVAKKLAPSIDWQQGSAEELPFSNDTFDAVLSQFGLMLFSSPKTALTEMKRVLKPGGTLIIAVFDSIEHIPAYEKMADLFARKVDNSVGEALRFPFSMGDTDKLYSLFSEVGLNDPNVITEKRAARFSSPKHMALSDVKGWFPFAQIHLDDQMIESIIEEAETVLEPYKTADGEIQFDLSVHIIKARKF